MKCCALSLSPFLLMRTLWVTTFSLVTVLLAGSSIAGAQTSRSVVWEPTVAVGVWTAPDKSRASSAESSGPSFAILVNRQGRESRMALALSAAFHTIVEERGTYSNTAGSGSFVIRQQLMMYSLGGDWALVQGPVRWIVGASGIVMMHRAPLRMPSGRVFGDDWQFEPGLGVRTAVTLPLTSGFALRVGADAFNAVESLTENRPAIGGSLGLTWRP